MADEEFWFCLKHHQVEGREGCRNKDRLGPYPTADEAAHALEKVEERNEAWEHDPAWNERDDPADSAEEE